MVQRVLIAGGLFVVLVGFQNCAKTSFSATNPGDLIEKSSLVPMDDMNNDGNQDASSSSDVADGIVTQEGTPADNGAQPPPIGDMPPADDNKPPKQEQDEPVADHQSEDSDSTSEDADSVSDADSDSSSEDSPELYACILKHHGKSVKLGIVNDELKGVNGVSQSVCISEYACNEIVSQAFEVLGPEDRGYCKGNPNVVRLSDEQVEALIAKELGQ